jgi:hypothetical protein
LLTIGLKVNLSLLQIGRINEIGIKNSAFSSKTVAPSPTGKNPIA